MAYLTQHSSHRWLGALERFLHKEQCLKIQNAPFKDKFQHLVKFYSKLYLIVYLIEIFLALKHFWIL